MKNFIEYMYNSCCGWYIIFMMSVIIITCILSLCQQLTIINLSLCVFFVMIIVISVCIYKLKKQA